MKKIFPTMLLASTALLMCACGDSSSETPTITDTNTSTTTTELPPEPVYKTPHGSGALFAEEEGFMSNDASVIEDENVRYVAYVSNENKDENVNSIYVRKGEKDANGKYVYSERKLAIKSGAWDKRISAPSIVKGVFKLGDETYKYLMAYQGTSSDENFNYSIGFAYANDIMGEWKKVGETASVTYNPSVHGNNIYGMGSPELINMGTSGELMLFYTWGEATLTCSEVRKINASDLSSIKVDGQRQITVKGLQDGGENPIFANAGFAFNKNKTMIYVARDVYPLSSIAPGHSNKIEVAKASSNIFDNITLSWDSVKTVLGSDTIIEDDASSLGWDELYSGSFVKDAYGYLDDSKALELVYSGQDEKDSYENDYRFSSFVCSMNIDLN